MRVVDGERAKSAPNQKRSFNRDLIILFQEMEINTKRTEFASGEREINWRSGDFAFYINICRTI